MNYLIDRFENIEHVLHDFFIACCKKNCKFDCTTYVYRSINDG